MPAGLAVVGAYGGQRAFAPVNRFINVIANEVKQICVGAALFIAMGKAIARATHFRQTRSKPDEARSLIVLHTQLPAISFFSVAAPIFLL